MKLMGKKGKRQIAKNTEKRTPGRRAASAEDKSTPALEPSVQNETDFERIAKQSVQSESASSTREKKPDNISVPKSPQSPQPTAQPQVQTQDEMLLEDIPELTKTPPPPKYLKPATRVPASQNAATEVKPKQNEDRPGRGYGGGARSVYARKAAPQQARPLQPDEMPPRDPLAPRSHVTAMKAASKSPANAGVGVANSSPDEHLQEPASQVVDEISAMPQAEYSHEPISEADSAVELLEPEYIHETSHELSPVEDGVPDTPKPELNAETKRFIPQNEPEKPVKRKKAEKSTKRAKNIRQKQKVKTTGSTGSKVALVLIILFVIAVAAGAGFFYWLTAHAVFEYNLQTVVIVEGADVYPEDFMYHSEGVSVNFRDEAFTPEPGRQTVQLILSYGLRSIDETAVLYVLSPVRRITAEFGSDFPDLAPLKMLSNADVARDVAFDLQFLAEPLPPEQYSVGEHVLSLELNGVPFDVRLNIVDTTPPTATPVSISLLIGEEAEAQDFVTNVNDASEIVSIEFVTVPDFSAGRDQIVEVMITDEFGNSYVSRAALSVAMNTEPPTIEGAETIHSMVGNPIIFRQGVIAMDDFGRELEFHVETAGVNQHAVGTYTVLYWVEDFSGNRTEVEVAVYIIDADPDYVNSRVDEIVEGILTEDMTQVQQARAIMRWVRSNIRVDTDIRGGPASVYEGAYRALRDRRGNCYIFYSISELLLTRAGVPNMRISRTPGLSATNHQWSLINPDGLGWHHFDSMPTRFYWSPQMYMFTQSQAERFAAELAPLHGGPNFYTFDPELYPDIVP